MRGILLYICLLLLPSIESDAQAQPVPLEWVHVGADAAHPVARADRFDLVFDVDQRPVLVSKGSHGIDLKRWNGSAWTGLAGLTFVNEFPMEVRAASNWAGAIIVGVAVSEPFGSSVRVFHVRGSQLVQLGASHRVSELGPFALAYDARGPVVALKSAGFVTVKRWNGAVWTQLGGNVNGSANGFREAQSPALAVTGDGRLVVAYTRLSGDLPSVEAKQWTGTQWLPLGAGPGSPSRAPTLAGMDNGMLVAASLAAGSQVSAWNGSSWTALPPPCPPSATGTTLAGPAISVAGSQMRIVCALGGISLLQQRLVARSFALLSGWTPLGGSPINGGIRLARPPSLFYVARAAPSGQLWVAWTAVSGDDGVGVIVSTLTPGGFSPGT